MRMSSTDDRLARAGTSDGSGMIEAITPRLPGRRYGPVTADATMCVAIALRTAT
jgi:hypothetical protein